MTTPYPDEASLLAAAREREPMAWSTLYETHYTSVYRYVRSRVRDQDTSEDLASEVFVRALAGIRSFSGGRPVLAWLFGIAGHVVADHHRQRERRSRFVQWWPFGRDDDEIAFDPPDDRAELGQTDDALDLAVAMGRLTAAQREVIRLRYFVDVPTAEIARTLGRDPAAVYSLHARALIALRDALDGDSAAHGKKHLQSTTNSRPLGRQP